MVKLPAARNYGRAGTGSSFTDLEVIGAATRTKRASRIEAIVSCGSEQAAVEVDVYIGTVCAAPGEVSKFATLLLVSVHA